jgi:hypothetical protein
MNKTLLIASNIRTLVWKTIGLPFEFNSSSFKSKIPNQNKCIIYIKEKKSLKTKLKYRLTEGENSQKQKIWKFFVVFRKYYKPSLNLKWNLPLENTIGLWQSNKVNSVSNLHLGWPENLYPNWDISTSERGHYF